MRIKLTQAARRRKIGVAHIRYVLVNTTPSPLITGLGEEAWLYIGPDDRGVNLEIIAIESTEGLDTEVYVLVVHVLPYNYRERN